jgi:hypothetical protein
VTLLVLNAYVDEQDEAPWIVATMVSAVNARATSVVVPSSRMLMKALLPVMLPVPAAQVQKLGGSKARIDMAPLATLTRYLALQPPTQTGVVGHVVAVRVQIPAMLSALQARQIKADRRRAEE